MNIDVQRYLKLSMEDRKEHIKKMTGVLLGQISWMSTGRCLLDSEPPSLEEIQKEWNSLKEMMELQISEAKECRSLIDQLKKAKTESEVKSKSRGLKWTIE